MIPRNGAAPSVTSQERRKTITTESTATAKLTGHPSSALPSPRLFACELCGQPALLLYQVLWLVAAVCPVCEPVVRGLA